MAVQSVTLTVGTTATSLTGGDADAIPGMSLIVQPSGGTVYLGGSDVTTGNGLPVSTAPLSIDLRAGEALWAVAASGTVTVNVLRSGV